MRFSAMVAWEAEAPQITTVKTVTLLIADVDYFKEENDRHGHIPGD